VILIWVFSLILLGSSIIQHFTGMTSQSIVELKNMTDAQERFIAAERAIVECEKSLALNISTSDEICDIQSNGQHVWKITSKQKPGIEVHVNSYPEGKEWQRLNWRQTFE
jgi:hypothetical protein